MDELLQYLAGVDLPSSERPNVSERREKTLTVGIVNKRSGGYGISASTTYDNFALLNILTKLPEDASIEGESPPCYTSICLNDDFACLLHRDQHNFGKSWIVATGSYVPEST